MKRRGFTLIEALMVLGIVMILAAILFPVIARLQENPHKSSCQSHLKQIGLGMMQYMQDYDERFPSPALNAVASSVQPFPNPYGWADALQPYIKSTQILRCTNFRDTPLVSDATQSGFTYYWMNSNLSRVELKNVAQPRQTLMFGDGDGSDARYNRNVLPKSWLTAKDSPALRHLDGANYAFVDGHVKWFKPTQIQIGKPNRKDSRPTFALR